MQAQEHTIGGTTKELVLNRPRPVDSLAYIPPCSKDVFEYYPQLAKVRSFVLQNMSERITLGDAARIAGMERTYFCNFFHRCVGVSFTEWLRRVRICEAIRIMTTSQKQIADISMECGFAEIRTFERVFKKNAGCTPREMRAVIERFLRKELV